MKFTLLCMILMSIISNFQDMRNAIDTFNGLELNGKRITLIEEAKGQQKSFSGGSKSRSKSPRSMFRSRSRSRSRSPSRSANIVKIGAGETTKVTDWICNFCEDKNEGFRYFCVTCHDAKPVDEERKTIEASPAIKSGNFSLQLKIT